MNSPPENPAAVTDHDKSSYSDRARTGTMWVVAAFGGGQIIRLASNIALAALLFEEVFALMAIVGAVMQGLGMFSDIGLRPNVVQNPRGEELAFLRTAWTMQVIRGFLLFLCAVILAWPMARFYGANDPMAFQLLWLIPLVGFGAVVDGLVASRVLVAERRMNVAVVIKMDFLVQVVNAAVMVLLAWYLRSVYALALAGLFSGVLRVWLSYSMIAGAPDRFQLERESVRSILGFGKWIFLSTAISFLAIQIDRLLLAAIFPLAEVGVYSMAFSLAMMVDMLNGAVQLSIVFPWYSRMLDKGVPLEDAFRRTRVPLMLVMTFVVVLLITGASSFFELAYDERYIKGGDFLPMLALAGWFSSLSGIYGSVFLAAGKPRLVAVVSAIKVLAFLAFLMLFLQFDFSIEMAVLAVVASAVVTTVSSQWFGRRMGLRNLRMESLTLLLLLGTAAAGWWLVHEVPWVAGQPPFLRLVLVGLLEVCLFAPLVYRYVLPMLKRTVEVQ